MTSKVSSNTEKVLRHKSLGVPPLNCSNHQGYQVLEGDWSSQEKEKERERIKIAYKLKMLGPTNN